MQDDDHPSEAEQTATAPVLSNNPDERLQGGTLSSETRQAVSATRGGGASTDNAANNISMIHFCLLVVCLLVTTFVIAPDSLVDCRKIVDQDVCQPIAKKVVAFSFLFGVIGSTLTASRTVVYAVRHGTYDKRRVLWQLMTPMHGGVLAVAGVYAVLGGLLALAKAPSVSEEYGYFVGAFAFIVGFSSELFVKRLILATEALFGEAANINSVSRHNNGDRLGESRNRVRNPENR